jgi:hypothetical protein
MKVYEYKTKITVYRGTSEKLNKFINGMHDFDNLSVLAEKTVEGWYATDIQFSKFWEREPLVLIRYQYI